MIAQLLAIALLAFDPTATGKALAHPEGRLSALRQILKLDAPGLAAAREANVAALVAALVGDAGVPFDERVLAVRSLALLGGDAGVQPLNGLLADASPQGAALALESARALRQLGALAALAPALEHPNPEVRAMGAAAGAGAGATLCALLADDAWPDVRAAAARGLVNHADAAACLAKGLTDKPRVATAAAQTAGEVGDKGLIGPLQRLAGDAKAPVAARAEALVSLTRLGHLGPAQTVMRTHLSKGGIEPLALAAVRGFASDAGDASRDLLRAALESRSAPVRLLAASALAERGDRASVPAIAGLRGDLPARQHEELDRILARLGQAPAVAVDPADSDPE